MIPIRFETFEHLLSHYAETMPEAPALYYADTEGKMTCTYGQLYVQVKEQALKWKTSGKTCIGVLSDGSFECIKEIFAANIAGMQIVMLDAGVPIETLKLLISITDVDVLYGNTGLKNSLEDSLTSGIQDSNDRIIFFTSGTTSLAKAVALTGHSLCQSAYNGGMMLPLNTEDTLMCMLPLGHVFGFVCGLLWGLSCGATVALGRGARHYIDDLSYFKPTALPAVPTLLGFLLKQNLMNENLRLVLIGAGDCQDEIIQLAKARGLQVSFGYGLTETSSGVAISRGEDPYAMDICPDDRIVIAGDGEILIDAPTCMMQGYYKQQGVTNRVLTNGLLHTGDIGEIDDAGRLHITGRKKEILVMGDGTKIFLPEYESKLRRVLNHENLAVALLNDYPCLIYSGEGDAREITNRLKTIMSDYSRSQQIAKVIVTAVPIPRTPTGKIKRWDLDQMLQNGI